MLWIVHKNTLFMAISVIHVSSWSKYFRAERFWQVCVTDPNILMYDTITTHMEGIYKLNHEDTSFFIRQLVSISVCIIKRHKTGMRMVNQINQMPRCFWAMPWLSDAYVVLCPSYLSLFNEQNQLLVPRFSEELFVTTQNQEYLAFFIDGVTGWKWKIYTK